MAIRAPDGANNLRRGIQTGRQVQKGRKSDSYIVWQAPFTLFLLFAFWTIVLNANDNRCFYLLSQQWPLSYIIFQMNMCKFARQLVDYLSVKCGR